MNSLSFLRSGPLLAGRAVGFGLINASKVTAKNPSFTLSRLPLQFRSAFSSIRASDEEASARAAALNADSEAPTIFDKIIAKEIPSTIVYEDEKADQRHGEILGHLLYAAKIVAEKEGIIDGFRVVINSGPSACQSVYHLHLHVLGGRQMKWPAG
ncbi:14 kDa zinc-binding protein-like isoform X5 [Primulina huaijiensis]|uniref:14 kDa zinc-binding protein-like isoform X5 n=1 Tax=Primulina huaijiensis TaxID=1492673 RepID=UPI003CC6FD71